jgi:hypothetical protein
MGAGVPVAVTVKLPACPTVKVVLAALVKIIGGGTVSDAASLVAFGLTPLATTQRNWSPLIANVTPLTVNVAVATPL